MEELGDNRKKLNNLPKDRALKSQDITKQPPMKILLVEDDEGTAEILRTTLREQHYLVDLVLDGQAGLEMAEAFTYDLISTCK